MEDQSQSRSGPTQAKSSVNTCDSDFFGILDNTLSSSLLLLSKLPKPEAPGTCTSSSSSPPGLSLQGGLLSPVGAGKPSRGAGVGSWSDAVCLGGHSSTGDPQTRPGYPHVSVCIPCTSLGLVEELSPSPRGLLSSGAYPPRRSPAGQEGSPLIRGLSRTSGPGLSGGADMNTPPSSLGSSTTTATTTTTNTVVTSISGNSVTAIPFSNSSFGGTAASVGNSSISSGEDCKTVTAAGEATIKLSTSFGTTSPNILGANPGISTGLLSTGSGVSGRDFTSTTNVGVYSGSNNISSNNSISFSTTVLSSLPSDSGLNVSVVPGVNNNNSNNNNDNNRNSNINIKPDSGGSELQLQQIKTGTMSCYLCWRACRFVWARDTDS